MLNYQRLHFPLCFNLSMKELSKQISVQESIPKDVAIKMNLLL